MSQVEARREAFLASSSQAVSGTVAQFAGSADSTGRVSSTGAAEQSASGIDSCATAAVWPGASPLVPSILSSTPAAMAAAQASPEKGTGLSAGLLEIVATATDCASAASAKWPCSAGGAQW